MTTEEFELDEDSAEGIGSYLRISRDATVEDLADLLPDKTEAERAEWLAKLHGDGNSVTLAVTVEVPTTVVRAFGETVPVRTVTGLILGPPGSERFLRRPAEQRVRADGAHHDAEPADPEARDLVCISCAGDLVATVNGHEHADNRDTWECIAAHDGQRPAHADDPERIAARILADRKGQ